MGARIAEWVGGLTLEQLLEPQQGAATSPPVFAPMNEAPTIERVIFLGIAHTALHLGEVEMLRGRLGLQGGPV